jgi:cytochrome c peroxidase
LTAPYMHDGSLTTLEAVVAYYQRGGSGHPGQDGLIVPLALSAADQRDLVAFLHALTGDNGATLARQARAASGPPAAP